MSWWWSAGLAVAALLLLATWMRHRYSHWARRGVKFVKPVLFFGNILPILLRRTSIFDLIQVQYRELKPHRFGGTFGLFSPGLVVTDPDLIREITVKSFDYFSDRKAIANTKSDPLLSRVLVTLKGSEWRHMRNHLSPAFTTSKLRGMFPLIARCGEQFARFLVTRPRGEPLEFKVAFTRVTNDVIATVAFGVESNAINNPEEEFYKTGQRIMDFSGFRLIKMFAYLLAPKLMAYFNAPIMPNDVISFFTKTIKDTKKFREENNVSRPDMLQLLMAAQKGGIERAHGDEQDAGTVGEDEHAAAIHKQHLAAKDTDNSLTITDDDIVAQAFLFFIGGFESEATILSFVAHELAVNPDVQQRLREEIDAAILENDGKLTYDNVQKMKYLDMVVLETLRKFPPNGHSDRICTKNYKVPGSDVVIEQGTPVMLPYLALQRDPEYFPDPERFDPERFSEENKKNIKPYTYLPFGAGPRNCLGMRFALLETKVVICYLLATCELRVSAKTEVPLKLSKKTFMMTTDAGFWLDCEPREEPTIKLDQD